ncbi:MAG: hypothetical protein WB788_05660 [Thermoplasmata archaeon]
MVFVRDEGSVYNAPLEEVWRFLSSEDAHTEAHKHRNASRKTLAANSGEYSWEQDFEGKPERFTMRWTSFPLFGIAYEVPEGPFAGSKFFVYYRPRGTKTRVTIVGDFVSPTIPAVRLEAAVLGFFALEFEQDSAAIAVLPGSK